MHEIKDEDDCENFSARIIEIGVVLEKIWRKEVIGT
jgi:hypothetical protein